MGSGGVAGGRGSSGNVLRDGTSDGGPGLRSADTAGRIASLYGAGQGTPGAGPTATGEWSPGPSGGTTGASSPGGSASARGTVRPEGFVAGRPGEDAPPPRNASPGSSGVFSAPLRPGEYQPTEPYRPAKRDDDPEEKRAKYKRRLAEKRGQDWGLRDATRGAFPITRPIRVECYADRLVLAAGRGTGPSQIVPLAGRTEASLDKLMTAVWERMDSWGMAGQGMYWRPVLQVQVAPDAEERFAELHKLLDGSGINVERK
jgi:hypothetical protein